MNKKLFPELIKTCMGSPLFGRDEAFTRVAHELADDMVKLAKAPVTINAAAALAILNKAASFQPHPTMKKVFELLLDAAKGTAIKAFSEIEWEEIAKTICKSTQEDFGSAVTASYVKQIYDAINRHVQSDKALFTLGNEQVQLLATKIMDDIHRRAADEAEFKAIYTKGVTKLWDIFRDTILGIIKFGYKKDEAVKLVFQKFMQINFSEILDADLDETIKYVFTLAVGGRTAPRVSESEKNLVVFAQANPMIELARHYYCAAILRQIFPKLGIYVSALPNIGTQSDNINSYDPNRIFKGLAKNKHVRAEHLAFIDELFAVTSKSVLDNINAAYAEYQKKPAGVSLSLKDMTDAVTVAADAAIKTVESKEPWGKSVGYSVRNQASIWAQEFYNELVKSPANFTDLTNGKTTANIIDEIKKLIDIVTRLSCMVTAVEEGKLQSDQNVATAIRRIQDELNPFKYCVNLPFIMKMIKKLGGDAGYWNRESWQGLFTELKNRVRQEIEKAISQYQPSERNRYVTVAQSIENPATVQQYLGAQTVSTGHHMQAIFLLDRLRRVKIGIPQAVDYLIGNIEQWGQTKNSGAPHDQTAAPQFPPSEQTDTTVQNAQQQAEKIEMPANYVWVNRDVIGLASAVLYGLLRQIHGQTSSFYGW